MLFVKPQGKGIRYRIDLWEIKGIAFKHNCHPAHVIFVRVAIRHSKSFENMPRVYHVMYVSIDISGFCFSVTV